MPSVTLKRKRGHNSSGGEMLQPESKGQKLGALMAKQMGRRGGGSAARTERAARGVRGIYLRTSGCGWRSSPSIETNATRSPGSPMYRHPAAA
mmetsp:Transcript_40230/g.76911  ORF Transcript_40230/g.76911 Transcript_40230/m.76911 type:complete len:93 (+) Transcript_40230:1019-1297(+)